MIKCQSCGKDNAWDAQVCERCGVRIASTRRKPRTRWIGVLFLVVGAAGIISSFDNSTWFAIALLPTVGMAATGLILLIGARENSALIIPLLGVAAVILAFVHPASCCVTPLLSIASILGGFRLTATSGEDERTRLMGATSVMLGIIGLLLILMRILIIMQDLNSIGT